MDLLDAQLQDARASYPIVLDLFELGGSSIRRRWRLRGGRYDLALSEHHGDAEHYDRHQKLSHHSFRWKLLYNSGRPDPAQPTTKRGRPGLHSLLDSEVHCLNSSLVCLAAKTLERHV